MKFKENGKLAMYTNLIMEAIAGSGIDAATKLSDISIKTMYDRLMTKSYVTQTWCIAGIPTFYSEPLVKRIRFYLFERHKDVDVIVHTHNMPVTSELNIKSDSFKAQMANAEMLYTKRQEVLDEGTETERVTGKTIKGFGIRFAITPKDVQRSRETFESYNYLYNRIISGGQAYSSNIFITASFKVGDKQTIKQFEQSLSTFMLGVKDKEISYYRVEGNLKACMASYGFVGVQTPETAEQFTNVLLTDENLSVLTPFIERGIHNTKGYLIGIDMLTMLPFMLNLTGSGSSQIILCAGQPGCGKTYTCGDGFVFGALVHNHYASIFDIKGNEYTNLLQFSNSILIDLSAKSGKYVNTLRLDDVPIAEQLEDGKSLYLNAINSTIGWLSAMVNLKDNEGNVRDLEGFLRKTLEYFYMDKGVIADNPYTFSNSGSMDIHDIPKYMNDIIQQAPDGSNTKLMGKIAHERCSVYLSSGSPSGNIFKEEVTLYDVVSKNLVIYSFGLNSGAYLEATEGIKSHMANAIDTKKEYYLKRSGKFLTVLYEELNSCKLIPFFIRNVSSRVVRSRSNNVNIVLLMNSLQVLLEKDFKDIASNIKTLICGKLNPIDFSVLDDLNASVIKDDVERIASGGVDNLENCFAIKYDTGDSVGSTIIKAFYPSYISEMLCTREIEE